MCYIFVHFAFNCHNTLVYIVYKYVSISISVFLISMEIPLNQYFIYEKEFYCL